MKRLTRNVLLAGTALLLASGASALPTRRGIWQNIRLADGRTILAQQRGNEHFSYYVDELERTYLPAADGTYALQTPFQLADVRMAKQAAMLPPTPSAGPLRAPETGEPPTELIGKKRGLVLLVDFPDQPFSAESTREHYERIFNELNFSEGRYKHSVRDYFLEQSRGQFDLEFDIIGPLHLTKPSTYYGENVVFIEGSHGFTMESYFGQLVMDAAKAAAPEIPTFEPYDWDGDHYVDQIIVVYAGLGEATGGASNTVWPAESSLSGLNLLSMYFPDTQPVTFGDYTINKFDVCNELNKVIATDRKGNRYYTDETIPSGIGIFCHEFGHCLGLPDFYDYDTGYTLGNLDVMDAGPSLDDYFQPCGFSAYERWFCGWQQPVVLEHTHQYDSIPAATKGGDSYVLFCDNAARTEYYLFENRQQVGTDAALPGNGLYVLHVDYDKKAFSTNYVNSVETGYHQRMLYLPASLKADEAHEAQNYYPYNRRDSISAFSLPRLLQYNGTHQQTVLNGHAIRRITRNSDGTMSFFYDHVGEPVGSDTIPVAVRSLEPTPSRSPRVFDLNGRPAAAGTQPKPGIYVDNRRRKVLVK